MQFAVSWASCQIRKFAGCACARNVFPSPTSKKTTSDPGMHHGTCVTHVPWFMAGSLTRGGGENVTGIPGAYATHNFTYLVRGPCSVDCQGDKHVWLIALPGGNFGTYHPSVVPYHACATTCLCWSRTIGRPPNWGWRNSSGSVGWAKGGRTAAVPSGEEQEHTFKYKFKVILQRTYLFTLPHSHKLIRELSQHWFR